jgi:PAS domain S-box-containing protein
MSDSPEARAEAVAKLKKIEAQLRLMTKVFMDSADPIVIRDLEGRVLDVNHEAERVFGWSREELIGQRTEHLHAPELREMLEEAHERRVRGEIFRNYEIVVRAKSGRCVPVLATGFLLTDENDEPVAMADILKDVTLMNQARERIQQRNRDLQQFSRALSHDLATPLNAIRGFTELLLEANRDQLGENGREHCQSIIDSVDRMDVMIRDLLELAVLDSDLVKFVPVDTSTTLDDALSNLQAVIQENYARVTSDPLPTVHGSGSLLCRLFQNLVGNAIKFRREEQPRVHVSAEQLADAWQFSVRDNGIGIDSEDHEKIFGPFQRLHAESIFPGTGIGLAACRTIVERHGGRIWVESQKGSGSIFRFTIPLHPPEEERSSPRPG